MKRVPYETMVAEFARVLEKKGFTPSDARDAAIIFAQNSLAGVFSHGLNRFPRVVSYLEKGEIDPNARATCEMSFGSLERWDGHRGFGPLNAKRAMDRACELAKQNGVGVVALGFGGGIGGAVLASRTGLTGNQVVVQQVQRDATATAQGSADGAAVLVALDRLYGTGMGEKLIPIGEKVGADVPFCLTGGTARQGRETLSRALPAFFRESWAKNFTRLRRSHPVCTAT